MCTKVGVLSHAQKNKYLLRNKLVVSKDGNRYLCKSCRLQIDQKKNPKKSEKHLIKYSAFPNFLQEDLKKVTDYVKILKKRKIQPMNEANIKQVLKLNKLEAHLLKLVIPFVRIAHCTRGAYFKVRGNLILISSR